MEIKLQNITKIFQAKDKTETVAVNALDVTNSPKYRIAITTIIETITLLIWITYTHNASLRG